MKKTLIVLTLILALLTACCARADETKEYSDAVYSFRYPADWDLQTADNGDIVIASPDGRSGVITFSVVTDLIRFTGDAEADKGVIEPILAQYSGANLVFSGEYEPVRYGGLTGYRAHGSWKATGQRTETLLLTGDRHLVGFTMIDDGAIALEELLAGSVSLKNNEAESTQTGFARWQNDRFSLDYPQNYSVLDQGEAVLFVNAADTSNVIMARAYALDQEYSDALGLLAAANMLPKSTHIEAQPVIEQTGGRNAAVIRGNVEAGPLAFYIIGSGRTALALLVTGEEAGGLADEMIASVAFE